MTIAETLLQGIKMRLSCDNMNPGSSLAEGLRQEQELICIIYQTTLGKKAQWLPI